MIRHTLPLIALTCVACAQERPVTELPSASSGACSSDKLAILIGKSRSEAVAKQALQLSGARTLRWIEPGMAVTMDYREDRLNLHLTADGKIERTGCN